MVDEVLISQRSGADMLHQQDPDAVFDEVKIAVIREARGEATVQAEDLVGCVQEEHTGGSRRDCNWRPLRG